MNTPLGIEIGLTVLVLVKLIWKLEDGKKLSTIN